MIYLVKDFRFFYTDYKIGFAKNVEQRRKQYATCNSRAQFLEAIATYGKTKHQLENALHKELKELGYDFITNELGIQTEWISLPFWKAWKFERLGLAQFKSCKGRKILDIRVR